MMIARAQTSSHFLRLGSSGRREGELARRCDEGREVGVDEGGGALLGFGVGRLRLSGVGSGAGIVGACSRLVSETPGGRGAAGSEPATRLGATRLTSSPSPSARASASFSEIAVG